MILSLMKKFIEKLFKGKSHQKEHSENLPLSENVSSVPESVPKPEPVCQEPEVLSSSQIENTKIISKVEKEVQAIVPIMRSEFNFLRYPFFDISHKTSTRKKLEIREKVTTEEGTLETFWRVSRNVENNFPASFARRIHTEVVERAINELKKPIPRIIKLGSLRDICQKLSITISGKNTKDIRNALVAIKAALIETRGTFRTKENNGAKKFFEGAFSLYDGVYFTGERLPDGSKADAVYVLLNDMYVQNYNNNYTVPLDYRYLQSLNGDIASRMYECLSLWFYPILENKKDSIQKRYSELCNYFPLVPQDEKKRAKGQLKKAHDQHVHSGILAADPEWLPIPGKSDDWVLKYCIGPAAVEWYRTIKTDKSLGIESAPTTKPQKKAPTPLPSSSSGSADDNPLVAELVGLGISQRVAEGIVCLADPDVIRDQIEALPYRRNIEDRAAFLIKAIEENYPIPEKVREERAAQERERVEKLEEAYNKFILSKVNDYLKTLPDAQIEREIAEHEGAFFSKYPHLKEFTLEVVKPDIRYDYKRAKAIELNLPSFDEWKNTL